MELKEGHASVVKIFKFLEPLEPLGLPDLFITLGFAALFLISVITALEKYPLVPFGDLFRRPEQA